MSRDVYQIESQTALEIVLVRTTLEEATDVTYTPGQFTESFNGGTIDAVWDNVQGYWGDERRWYFNKPELIRQVVGQLDKTKEVSFPLSEYIMQRLQEYNPMFKEHGFMYRPSKGVFVKWKAKPKKVVISKDLMNRLRNFCNEAVAKYVCSRYKFGFKLESCANKKDQVRVLKFGHDLGFTWDIFMEMEACDYRGYYIPDQQKYVFSGKTVPVWVMEQLVSRDEEQMYDATIAEFKKWFDDSLVAVEDEEK